MPKIGISYFFESSICQYIISMFNTDAKHEFGLDLHFFEYLP